MKFRLFVIVFVLFFSVVGVGAAVAGDPPEILNASISFEGDLVTLTGNITDEYPTATIFSVSGLLSYPVSISVNSDGSFSAQVYAPDSTPEVLDFDLVDHEGQRDEYELIVGN